MFGLIVRNGAVSQRVGLSGTFNLRAATQQHHFSFKYVNRTREKNTYSDGMHCMIQTEANIYDHFI